MGRGGIANFLRGGGYGSFLEQPNLSKVLTQSAVHFDNLVLFSDPMT